MQIFPWTSSTLVPNSIKVKPTIKHKPLVFNSEPKTKMELTLHPSEQDPTQFRLHIEVLFKGKTIWDDYTESTVSSPDKCPDLLGEVSEIFRVAGIYDFDDEAIRKKLSNVNQIGGSGKTGRKSGTSWKDKWFYSFRRSV